MTRLQAILGVALVFQCALIALWDTGPERRYAPTPAAVSGRWFPAFDPDAVVELRLLRDGKETRLRRSEGGWVVETEGGAPADASAVEAALATLADLEGGIVVSENPGKFEDFGVEGAEAIEVRAVARDGAEVAALVVGRSTADWRSTYVRHPPDASVVLWVERPIRQVFDRDGGRPGAWQDRTVTDLDPLKLRVVEIRREDALVSLERVLDEATGRADPKDRWRMTRPLEGLIGRYQGQAIAETVAHLVADTVEVGVDPSAAGLAPPEAEVVGRAEDGSEAAFEIGRKVGQEDRFRYVRPKGGRRLFRVATYRLLGLLRDPADLIASADREGGGGEDG